MVRCAGLVLLATVLGACKTAVVGQAPTSLAITPLFGPVIGAEVIGGRADTGDVVVLLAGGIDLVRIELSARRSERTHLALAPGESCWGLARLTNGALWTLKGRRTLARLGPDGRIDEQVALASPHFGIFAAGDRLVYQEATFSAPGPALKVALPDGAGRVPWSGITTRTYERLARASAAVLNMVSCGATLTSERACWFPDEPGVFLVGSRGQTRHVALSGLDVASPETLLTSDNPARPVRDAYVDATGEIWVLSTGAAPAGAPDTPGGWIVARYGPDGAGKGRSRLPEAARLILHVDPSRVTLLLSSGKVGEVRRW
jgi:hypothetical protein